MGEQNNSVSRGRKRKGSSKSNTKSNKRKASAAEVIVKQEPMSSSPMTLPRSLELSTAGIPQNTLPNDDPQQLIPINDKLPTLSEKPNLTTIPNEIFVQICANLPPNDLLTLTLVCQRFKGLLCSPSSHETQAIWRTSRTKFMRFLQSPPPPMMDEKSYIVLKQLRKGCQFCHETNLIKVYWEFRVRCCEQCLDNYIMSRDKLFIDHCIPNEVFRTLPHIFRIASRFYWTKDVIQAYNEFCNLRDEEKQEWVERREEIANMVMQETAKHKLEEQNEQIECLTAQSPNSNYTPQPPTPQQRIYIRQPQLTTAPMNFASMASMTSMAPMNPMPNMSSIPTIPSMGTINPQPQFQQFNQSPLLVPQMQSMMPFNRSQFMITTPPAQQFYSHSPFVSRVTRQMIPSHMMAGAPQTLTPPQMLTPQMVSPPMVSPHCFGVGVPQYHRF